jgi:hypothetical protein
MRLIRLLLSNTYSYTPVITYCKPLRSMRKNTSNFQTHRSQYLDVSVYPEARILLRTQNARTSKKLRLTSTENDVRGDSSDHLLMVIVKDYICAQTAFGTCCYSINHIICGSHLRINLVGWLLLLHSQPSLLHVQDIAHYPRRNEPESTYIIWPPCVKGDDEGAWGGKLISNN